jgi:hypothetical protein
MMFLIRGDGMGVVEQRNVSLIAGRKCYFENTERNDELDDAVFD